MRRDGVLEVSGGGDPLDFYRYGEALSRVNDNPSMFPSYRKEDKKVKNENEIPEEKANETIKTTRSIAEAAEIEEYAEKRKAYRQLIQERAEAESVKVMEEVNNLIKLNQKIRDIILDSESVDTDLVEQYRHNYEAILFGLEKANGLKFSY